jgi:hypothetical protein
MKTIFLSQGGWKNNSSGIRGVNWHKKNRKWYAAYMYKRKKVFVGAFETKEEAAAMLLASRASIEKPIRTTLVSDEDYEYLSQFSWNIVSAGSGYVTRTIRIGGKKKLIYMHREIIERMGISPSGRRVDHRNLDTFDNQRSNLRIANASESNCNIGLRSNNSSGVKGVQWAKTHWLASISKGGKVVWRKSFLDLQEAARVRAEMLPTFHGEFARIE